MSKKKWIRWHTKLWVIFAVTGVGCLFASLFCAVEAVFGGSGWLLLVCMFATLCSLPAMIVAKEWGDGEEATLEYRNKFPEEYRKEQQEKEAEAAARKWPPRYRSQYKRDYALALNELNHECPGMMRATVEME
jgi:SNF family Na+-dependent transporter